MKTKHLTNEESMIVNDIKRNVLSLTGNWLERFHLFDYKPRGDYDVQSELTLLR